MSSRAKKYGIPNCIIEENKYIYKQVSELKISEEKIELELLLLVYIFLVVPIILPKY